MNLESLLALLGQWAERGWLRELDRAFAAMLGGRPGPAHIEIPTDVMGLPCPALEAPAALPQHAGG